MVPIMNHILYEWAPSFHLNLSLLFLFLIFSELDLQQNIIIHSVHKFHHNLKLKMKATEKKSGR